jgi:hypothetical protein
MTTADARRYKKALQTVLHALSEATEGDDRDTLTIALEPRSQIDRAVSAAYTALVGGPRALRKLASQR